MVLRLVVAAHHPDIKRIQASPHTIVHELRHIITHDTSQAYIAKSAGLVDGKQHFYVQTTQQKIEAIKAGIGIGHLPEHIVHPLIARGDLIDISHKIKKHPTFMAWKIKNKGKALAAFKRLFD